MVEFEQCGSLLNKSIMTIDTNSQCKYQIRILNDKQINDVVVVETHVVILPF
jgi:CTP:phosphocholine cytidylyltransferase-like protein